MCHTLSRVINVENDVSQHVVNFESMSSSYLHLCNKSNREYNKEHAKEYPKEHCKEPKQLS